jgi:cell wall-associated NlpC family hydrolase
MNNWANKFVGLPFLPNGRDENGLDCWGLVVKVYEDQLGIKLPQMDGAYESEDAISLRRISVKMKEESQRWVRSVVPQIYDVALMRWGSIPCHVGICIGNGYLLHIERKTLSCIQRLTDIDIQPRIVGYFRYAP